jgi:hypothetical protein
MRVSDDNLRRMSFAAGAQTKTQAGTQLCVSGMSSRKAIQIAIG